MPNAEAMTPTAALWRYSMLILAGREDDAECFFAERFPTVGINLNNQRAAMQFIFEQICESGKSLADIEERSGVAANSVFAWRNCHRAPQINLLAAVATAAGCGIALRSPSGEETDASSQRNLMTILFNAMAERGIAAPAAAARSGISVNSIYAWKAEKRSPTLAIFVKFIESLGFELIVRKNRAGHA